MFVLKVENWIGELELVVKCESKENAIKALKITVNTFLKDFLVDNTMEEFIAGFGEYDTIIKEEKFTIPYEGNILIDNMLPQEIEKLDKTPNHLGGCMVMTFKKFMEENL